MATFIPRIQVLPRSVWNQLKGLTVEQLARALEKDNWTQESRAGATIRFVKTSANGAAMRRLIRKGTSSRKKNAS